MQGGYDIGASAAASSSATAAGTLNAGTTFNFASPRARGDAYDNEVNPTSVATATATTAKGDGAKADVSNPVTLGGNGAGIASFTNDNARLLVIAGITIATLATIGFALYAQNK